MSYGPAVPLGPATSVARLRQHAQSSYPETRVRVAQHRNAPRDVLTALLQDSDNRVASAARKALNVRHRALRAA